MLLRIMFFLFISCTDTNKIDVNKAIEEVQTVDEDGDGYLVGDDCNDNDATINPGAEEICDGFDNDCDAQVDEDVTTVFYEDKDADGFGDAATVVPRLA